MSIIISQSAYSFSKLKNFLGGAHGRETSHYQQAAIFELGAMILQNMFGALSFLRYQKVRSTLEF